LSIWCAPAISVDGAVRRLREMGSMWSESPRALQRDFVREVFARVEVCGPQIVAITPKEAYSPLFLLDRADRFNGDQGVVWLPGQVSGQHHYTPVVDPRTGKLLCIPALVLLQAA